MLNLFTCILIIEVRVIKCEIMLTYNFPNWTRASIYRQFHFEGRVVLEKEGMVLCLINIAYKKTTTDTLLVFFFFIL